MEEKLNSQKQTKVPNRKQRIFFISHLAVFINSSCFHETIGILRVKYVMNLEYSQNTQLPEGIDGILIFLLVCSHFALITNHVFSKFIPRFAVPSPSPFLGQTLISDVSRLNKKKRNKEKSPFRNTMIRMKISPFLPSKPFKIVGPFHKLRVI